MEIRLGDYMVHFKFDTWIYFKVYPINDWEDMKGNTGFAYCSKTSSDMVDVFNEETCREIFRGSFCWRGVWEGRIYFTDYEYWGEELKEISDLYNNQIVPWCKDYIKKESPKTVYED